VRHAKLPAAFGGDQAENQFHELFSREFAAAYKAQLDRLK
jgi:hypothetical protein